MLKIWGRINSINVQKAVLAAAEAGVPYERIDAGAAFGKNKTPDYLAMNPMGLVPVLEDGPFHLFESNAIVRYLAAKHSDGKLWPKDAHVRAHADQWMDWQSSALTPAMHGAFWALIRTPATERDPAVIEASRIKTEEMLVILDAHLARHEWMAGSAVSVAEIAVGCAVHRWLHLPLKRESRPHVERWYKSYMTRPAAKILPLPVT